MSQLENLLAARDHLYDRLHDEKRLTECDPETRERRDLEAIMRALMALMDALIEDVAPPVGI